MILFLEHIKTFCFLAVLIDFNSEQLKLFKNDMVVPTSFQNKARDEFLKTVKKNETGASTSFDQKTYIEAINSTGNSGLDNPETVIGE